MPGLDMLGITFALLKVVRLKSQLSVNTMTGTLGWTFLLDHLSGDQLWPVKEYDLTLLCLEYPTIMRSIRKLILLLSTYTHLSSTYALL